MENKICVYAICKNESKFVDRWYESMKEADHIVVLDTGSTDNTVELLKKYPNIDVYEEVFNPWRFDTARNKAISYVPDDCNILYSSDLDEVFEPGWADEIRKNWKENHTRGTFLFAWSHFPDGKPDRIFSYTKLHTKEWYWKYPVHELLVRDNTGFSYDRNELCDLYGKIFLHHYPDPNKSRGFYLPLLEQRVKEDVNHEDAMGAIYLSHEYFYHKMYKESIESIFNTIEIFGSIMTDLDLANMYYFIGDNYKELHRNADAIDFFTKSCNTYPTYIDPYIKLCMIYSDIGDYDSAEKIMLKGLKMGVRQYSWLEKGESWDYLPWDLLAVAAFYNNHKLLSLGAIEKALSFNPENEHLLSNKALIMSNFNPNTDL